MEKPDCSAVSGGSTVFIDTSLDTHLAVNVYALDTVSDLKKKILYEHPLIFPKIGQIKINAVKVKRKGYLYHLSDSVFVKSAFDGSKSWFLSVDASSAEEHNEDHNSLKADTSNVLVCVGNNSSADVVDDPSKRLHNINNSCLLQDGESDHGKLHTASHQLGFDNSFNENPENLNMEAEHMAESNSKVSLPGTKKVSRQKKDVRDNKLSEDLPDSIVSSVLKEKHKSKKRKKDDIQDHDFEESGALAAEIGKDALELNNANDIADHLNTVSEKDNGRKRSKKQKSSTSQVRSEISFAKDDNLNTSQAIEAINNKDLGNEADLKIISETVPDTCLISSNEIQEVGKTNRFPNTGGKNEKTDGDDGNMKGKEEVPAPVVASLMKIGDLADQSVSLVDGHRTPMSQVETNLQDNNQVSGHQNQSGKLLLEDKIVEPKKSSKKIKRSKKFKDPVGDALEAENDIGLVSGAPKPSTVSVIKDKNDMTDGDDGNMKGKEEVPAADVASLVKIGDLADQSVSLVDDHRTPVSQVETNLQDNNQVSGHQNQSGKLLLEDKIVEPKKSSKKIKRPKKLKDPVGEANALEAENDIGLVSGAPKPSSVSVIKATDSTDLNASHGNDHLFLLSQEGINLQNGSGVSEMENQSVKLSLEDKTVEPNKSSKKRKKPKKIEVPVEQTEQLNTESNRGPTSESLEPEAALVLKTRDSVYQNASHVNSQPTLVSQEGVNLRDEMGVSAQQGKSGTLENELLEPQTSSRKSKKSKKKIKDPIGGTEALDGGHDRDLASVTPQQLNSLSGDRLLDNAGQANASDGNEALEKKILDFSPSVANMNADDVIQGVLESLEQCNKNPANAENMEKKSREKNKKKNPAVVEPLELQREDNVDQPDPIVRADNVSEVSASSKSTRKTKLVNSKAAAQLNGSDLGYKIKTRAARIQLDSSLTKSDPVVDAINNAEVPFQSEGIKDHHHRNIIGSDEMLVDKMTDKIEAETELKLQMKHDVQSENIVDSGRMLVDKVTDKREENEVKVKKKRDVQSEDTVGSSEMLLPVTNKGVETEGSVKKKQPDVQFCGLPSLQILNGNRSKKAKSKTTKSSSIQSQRSSSKAESLSYNVQSSKALLTISESAANQSLRSNKSSKINSKPKDAQRPVDINSSMVWNNVEKKNAHAASSSIAKSDKGKVVNSLQNKSLLATAGTIFKNDDVESSDDENVDTSDDSTRAPSDSSSSDDSKLNADSSRNGFYDSEREEGGGSGRNLKTPRYSKPKGMSLDAILRSSSSYKKARLTASQSQADDFDSVPECVPDSQGNM